MPAAELQWTHLVDFTPGIHNRVNRTGFTAQATPNSAIASPTNTHRCIALRDGGLAPLWHRDYSLAYDTLPAVAPATQFQITGFYVAQPVQVANSLREHEFWFGVEWIDNTNRQWHLRRYRPFTPAWDAVLATNSSTVLPTTDQYKNTLFITTRSNQATPTSPGAPVVFISHSAPGPANPSRQYTFPNDAALGVTATETVFTDLYYPSRLLGHQGRVVLFNEVSYDHGAVGDWLTNENLLWTAVNDTDTLVSTTATVFGVENPAGYAVVASMSANELLAVKRFGGGLFVSGDLDNPTVVTLPMVPSASNCIPAVTPIGVVYLGANGGVYAWQGGDTAEAIGRQLDDYAWKVTGSVLLDFQHQSTMVGTDHIVLPRGWVYDIHGQSWWRLENEADLRQHLWAFQQGFSNAQSPFLYGATIEFDDTSDALIYGWDTATPAKSYSWQSHPVWATINKEVLARSVIVEAVGTGTVTITITGRTGDSDSVIFTLASNSILDRQRKDINVRGDSLVIRIESDGIAAPAPIVAGVHVGWQEDHTIEIAA